MAEVKMLDVQNRTNYKIHTYWEAFYFPRIYIAKLDCMLRINSLDKYHNYKTNISMQP